jgi:hypothetical protein
MSSVIGQLNLGLGPPAQLASELSSFAVIKCCLVIVIEAAPIGSRSDDFRFIRISHPWGGGKGDEGEQGKGRKGKAVECF